MKTTKTRARIYRLALDFRRAVQQAPSRQRPGLRAWLLLRRAGPFCGLRDPKGFQNP